MFLGYIFYATCTFITDICGLQMDERPFRTFQERIPGRAIQNIPLPLPAQEGKGRQIEVPELAVLVRVHGTVLLGNSDAISHFPYPTPDPTPKITQKVGYPTHIPG